MPSSSFARPRSARADENAALITAALLYACSLSVQWLSALARTVLAAAPVWALLNLLGASTQPMTELAALIGFAPVGFSLLTLALPLGGPFWQLQEGGRTPSARERLIYEDALQVLRSAGPRLRPPRHWFVLDDPEPAAAAYADGLMVTRGLLDSGFLEPVLAHELGHLNSYDARLTAALCRLTTPPRRRVRFPFGALALIVSGGAGAWLMRLPWASFWRSREFAADAYAARLGQGEPLARYLESYALANDLPVPFPWLKDHTHPSTEHRIEQLLEIEQREELR
jgi:Zn-dependent protease with chaperone function